MKPTNTKENSAQQWQAFDALEASVSESWEAVLQAKLDRIGKRKSNNSDHYSLLLLFLAVVNIGVLLFSIHSSGTPAESRVATLQTLSKELLSSTNN